MGRVRGKEKSVAVENSAMKLLGERKNIIVSGKRQAGRKEENCNEK